MRGLAARRIRTLCAARRRSSQPLDNSQNQAPSWNGTRSLRMAYQQRFCRRWDAPPARRRTIGERAPSVHAYGILWGPYLTIFTLPRLTGCAFGGATSETTPVLKFMTKMSVDQRVPVWTNQETISILWPTGSAV